MRAFPRRSYETPHKDASLPQPQDVAECHIAGEGCSRNVEPTKEFIGGDGLTQGLSLSPDPVKHQPAPHSGRPASDAPTSEPRGIILRFDDRGPKSPAAPSSPLHGRDP